MTNRLFRTGLQFLLIICCNALLGVLDAQCPVLNNTSNLASPDCTNGTTVCDLCPGDQITLTASGTNLPGGGMVNWYYGTTNNFNPYNGQGTLLGASTITGSNATPCTPCPTTLLYFVEACGSATNADQSNEFMVLWSGGGFSVDDVSIDLPTQNNTGNAENSDLGTACPFQYPTAFALGSIAGCAGVTIVGVGPGDAVPPNVPVVIFMSESLNFSYNWTNLCPFATTVYVMQNSCARSIGAFSNGTSSGTRTTTVSLSCGCNDVTTYNTASLVGTDGAYIIDGNTPFGTIYGNVGCSFPAVPFTPPTPTPATVNPFTTTIPQSMCNGGPYWMVGTVDPLAVGCTGDLTNYMPFNVVCPDPTLSTAEICESTGSFDLNSIEDPAWPNGTWSGSGVTGNNFNPGGNIGANTLTFTPAGACGTPATTTVVVSEPPSAGLSAPTSICSGEPVDVLVDLTGMGPWSFTLRNFGALIGSFNTNTAPFTYSFSPSSDAQITLEGLSDNNCSGPPESLDLLVNDPPDATISLVGPSLICGNQISSIQVTFSGGTPPFSFVLEENGVSGSPITTSQNPYVMDVSPTVDVIYTLASVSSGPCSGNVSGSAEINVGTGPIGSLQNGNASICDGESSSLNFSFTGIGPFTFVYAINNVSQAPITTNNTTYNLPLTPAVGISNYTLVSLTNGTCSGTVSGLFSVTTKPKPTLTMSGDAGLCGVNTVPITFNFTGTGPFTANYNLNGTPQTPVITGLNTYTLDVTPSQNSTYTPVSVTAGGCTGTVSGDAMISIASSLSAVLSGGGPRCMGGPALPLTIDFEGAGPYTFVVRAGATLLPPVTTNDDPYILNVTPNSGTLYTLVSVTNGSCTGTVNGSAQVLVFLPPTAEILPFAQPYCNPDSAILEFNLTGTGPFTIVYSINGVNQPPFTTFEDPYFVSSYVTNNTTFRVESIQSPGCSGVVVGNPAVAEVNQRPVITNFMTQCDLATATYTIELDASNGEAPYTVTGATGTWTGTHFTSNPIPAATSSYNIVLTDPNNCGQDARMGMVNCNCSTSAGTMSLLPIDVCQPFTVTCVHNGGQVLPGGSVLKYILHTNPANPTANIVAWSNTPTFPFINVNAETVYYVSAIAGNPAAGNTVNLQDPCLSVSDGTPVRWHAAPNISLGADVSACQGDTIMVPVTLSGSIEPPYSFQYQLNGTTQPLISNLNNTTYILAVVPPGNATITVLNVQEKYCSNAAPNESMAITLVNQPLISNLTTNCNLINSTYTVEFDVLQGMAPYTITGLMGNLVGNHFTSSAIPLANNYNITLRDVNNCGQDTRNGMSNCSCNTDAGQMNQTALSRCTGQPATAVHNGQQVLDPEDVFYYILHTSPGNPIGNILASSPTPTFSFIPGSMFPDVTYYISAIAGNNDGSGLVLITDPCLSVATGTPVVWHDAPTAQLFDDTYDICPNESQALTIFFTGKAPYNFTYSLNNATTPGISTGNSFTINTTLTQSSVFKLLTVTDNNGCTGTATGTANIDVHTVPIITNVDIICSTDNLSYIVEFDVTNADLDDVNLGGSLQGSYNEMTGHFVSGAVPIANTYSAVASDNWQCGVDSISGVAVCNCDTDAGQMSQTPLLLCSGQAALAPLATGFNLDNNDTLIYILATTPGPPTWTILGTNNIPSFSFNAGLLTPDSTYYIVAVAGNVTPAGLDFGDPCLSVATGTPVRWKKPVTAFLMDNQEICQGDTATLVIHFVGSAPYNFTYLANSLLQPSLVSNADSFQLVVSPTLSVNYSLASVNGGGCPGSVMGGAALSVILPPDLIDLEKICDFAAQTYTVSFKIANGVAPNPFYNVSGLTGNLQDTTFTSNPIPINDPFNVTVTNPTGCVRTLSGVSGCSCSTDAGTLNLMPLSACVEGAVSIIHNGDYDLDADDDLQYVLYENPSTFPAGIITTSETNQIAHTAAMTVGTTYYVSAIAGNTLANGMLDLNDPCLSVSPPVPVVFRDKPTAIIAGDTTVCEGSNVIFPVRFTGTGPFTFVYSLNGTNQLPIQAPQSVFQVSTSNILSTQTFTLVSVSDSNCPGTVSGLATVSTLPSPSISITGNNKTCLGVPIELTLNLSGGTSYEVSVQSTPGGLATYSNIQDGFKLDGLITASTTFSIDNFVANGNDCPIEIGQPFTVEVTEIETTLDAPLQNGYEISCGGASDGAISATSNGGIAPYQYVWSNNQTGSNLTNLAAGTYSVTVTDSNGCTDLQNITLTEPASIDFTWTSQPPTCTGTQGGQVSINTIQGGVNPYTINIDGVTAQPIGQLPANLTDLDPGSYEVVLKDANGCTTTQNVEVGNSEELLVSLGNDVTIAFGDSLKLEGVTNSTAIDTFIWTPAQYLKTPEFLETYALPFHSIRYSLEVIDTNGCKASDDLLVVVRKDNRIYIPNVINIGSSTGNDVFTVFAGAEVEGINLMRIYDRWGECLFESKDFRPGDATKGWNGKWRDKDVLPGVYVYVVEVQYIDGTTEQINGDVTVTH